MLPADHYKILSAIKRCFSRSPTHREALNKAKCKRKTGPRGGARYQCAKCKEDFGLREVQVDHKDPVIPLLEKSVDMSWDYIISRIYCSVSNLQVLCKACHAAKSKKENKVRRAK